MAAPRSRTVTLRGWPSGVNNVFREENTPQTQLREALNVDLLEQGKVRRREGYQKVIDETSFRSLTSFANKLVVAQGSTLYFVDPNSYAKTAVGTVSPNEYLSYEEVNDMLVVADGVSLKRLYSDGSFKDLAPENPAGQPDVDATSIGGLPAGEYQVAITFTSDAGESGSTLATALTLTTEGGISVSNIPQPTSADVTAITIYVTPEGGSDFKRAKGLDVGETTAFISQYPTGLILETQFMSELPAGNLVTLHNAQLCSAVGKDLYYSEPFRFGQTREASNFIRFATDITMLISVDDGVFVGLEDQVVFLRGNTLDDASVTTVDYDGVVPGTPVRVSASALPFLELSPSERVVVWWSMRGVLIVGQPNGAVRAVREAELSLPEFERGAIIPREENGVQQLVSALSGVRRESKLAVADSVGATVYRNNIEI